MNDLSERDRTEARLAGQRALDCLYAAKRELSGARGWGVLDLLGGGLITSAIKRSKMGNAEACMEDARRELDRFASCLRDLDLELGMGGFLHFVDIWSDGMLGDLLTQSKIARACERIDEAIARVERLLREL